MTAQPDLPDRFDDAALSRDGFLGGKLQILQPLAGYRAATDPVFLAAATPAKPGESVLELGCGAGVASLCLAARVPGLTQHGIELQPAYADLARRNAAANALALTVTTADLQRMPPELRALSFDHVIANPPYYFAEGGTAAADPGRERALREATPLAEWIDAGLRRLRPGGMMTLIQEAVRLPEMLAALMGRAGAIRCLPLAGRSGRPAQRVILQARKTSRGPFQLLAPLVLHEGDRHLQDGTPASPVAEAILRKGAPLLL